MSRKKSGTRKADSYNFCDTTFKNLYLKCLRQRFLWISSMNLYNQFWTHANFSCLPCLVKMNSRSHLLFSTCHGNMVWFLPTFWETGNCGCSAAWHWGWNASTIKGQKQARRNTPLRLGLEKLHRALQTHISVLSSIGLSRWCQACSAPSYHISIPLECSSLSWSLLASVCHSVPPLLSHWFP